MQRTLALACLLTLVACEQHGACESTSSDGGTFCTLTSSKACTEEGDSFTEVAEADPAKDDAAYENVDAECNALGYAVDCDGNWVASAEDCEGFDSTTSGTTTASGTE
jgi:hypothetical protein